MKEDMKTLFQNSLKVASITLVLLAGNFISVSAQTARLQTSQLDYLTGKASTTVDVALDERLLQKTAALFKDPGEADVKAMLTGIKGIYVKSFEFDQEGEYSQADLESIRSQLREPLWSRIIGVISKKSENVEVYLMNNGDQIAGMAVLSFEPKEITIVNILGNVDFKKLTALEDSFGIPVFGIDPDPKETKAKPKR
jgi:hypothetical protein